MSDQPGCPCSICDEDAGCVGQSADCNPHPDAPHGFDRTASLNEDRYVCDCESWSETNRADDSLRTRIAAVLYEDGQRPMHTAARLADAVIRELGLREERRRFDTLFANRDEPQHRYVTDWTADQKEEQ